MARGAIVLREFGPRLGLVGGASGEQLQSGMGGGKPTDRPGADFEVGLAGAIRGVRPMARQLGVVSGELEKQTRMAGRDQVVIDIHTRRANVALSAKPRSAGQRLRVVHAETFFFRRRLRLPAV